MARIDDYLDQCRRTIHRVEPWELRNHVLRGALVVDIRPLEQRSCDGGLLDAIVIDRNVLEWRLDLTCPFRLPEATRADREVILVCNEGYSSSLAAASLRAIGLGQVGDLRGGFQAWLAWSQREATAT